MDRTLLALHAHPDDESSKTAATVAHYADAGVRCVLVMATGGEEGDILNSAMDRPEVRADLTGVRRTELEKAAAIIGYHQIIYLGFRDSGMPGTQANHHPDAFVNAPSALADVVTVLRRERPQVVLGYDDHRYYPHPDHLRVWELGLEAFAAAADPGRFPECGAAWEVGRLAAPVFSRQRLQVLHDAAEAAGIESQLGPWLAGFNDDHTDRVDVRVPIAATFGRAQEALRAHATQIDPDGFWFHIPENVAMEAYPFEDYQMLASRYPLPAGDDLFAGIG